MFELQVYLEKKAQTDSEFSSKFSLWLITTSKILAKIGTMREFPLRFPEDSRKILAKILLPLLPGPHAYHGQMKKERWIWDSYRVLLRNPLQPKKRLPPQPYIGVGYRDKGSLRDPAKDGSPHWKEVAMSSIKELLFFGYRQDVYGPPEEVVLLKIEETKKIEELKL
jgi:hypothetical protein